MKDAQFLALHREGVAKGLASLAENTPLTAAQLGIERDCLAPLFAALLSSALVQPEELGGEGTGLGCAIVAMLGAVDAQIEALSGDESRQADLLHLRQVREGLAFAHWGVFFDTREPDAPKLPRVGLLEKAVSAWRAFVAWGLEKPGTPQL